MNGKRLFLFLALLLSINAYSQLKIDAEIRPRFEYRDGYKTLLSSDQSPAFVISQRSRVNFGYTDEKYTIFLSVQDSRIWGEAVSKTDAASIDLFEAWAQYNFTNNFSMKVGKQSLSYDDKHLLGPNDWNNVGATHDIAMLKYKEDGFSVDLAGGYNNNSDKTYESNYPLNTYKYLSYLWINKAITKNLSVSVLNLLDGYQKEESDDTVYTRATSGFYANYLNDSSFYSMNLSGYYQYGKSKSGSKISAYFFSIAPEFKISQKLKMIIALDYFSGDNALKSDSEVNSFSNLYGDGHGLYGYMDYFTTIDSHTEGSGLADLYLRLNYNPSKKTNIEATIHNFRLTNNAIDSISTPGVPVKADRNLGTEIDLMVKHKLSTSAELRFGFSTMLATKSMEIFKGGDHSKFQSWGWMMFVFKPTLYKSEKKQN
ncbi:MAG TPA: alginate export family protein [Tenuifilaceae bacterium]|nr:alginate export family protein [Tenuifilaceae bacterium]HOZ16110.1 alginate export family protein [Tenuifilaceae bacterium]HPI44798.1 alginate export family protein [Tenuifilaceae bacterium]HPN22501.1 alginate export family protein [Tenuifilaceae bacterium]